MLNWGIMANIAPLIKCFINSVCAGKNNETPTAYEGKLRRFATWLGDRELTQLTQTDLDNFRIYLQNRKTKQKGRQEVNGGLSPHTIHSVLNTVRYFVKWCFDHGHLPSNLAAGWKIPIAPKPEPKAISPENITRLIDAASQQSPAWERARNVAMLYMLRDTGGRVSGLLNADLDNINLTDARLTTTEKGKPRTLYLSEPTVAAIREWLCYRHQVHPTDYKLFSGARGNGISRSGVYHVLDRLAAAGHVDGRRNPHSFRHAFARDSLKNGADLSQVSQLMGHTSIVVTADYYARWDDKELQAVHQRCSPGRQLPDPVV